MPFCASCGSPVEGQFCTKCGTPLAAPAAPAAGQPMPVSGAPATTGMSDNVAGALCYLLGLVTGILFLVLAPYNQSKFVRFHAFQSIFFNVGWIALWIADAIISAVMPFGLGIILALLSLVIWLGGMVLWIVLMVKAYQNQKWHLPVIGDLAEKQA